MRIVIDKNNQILGLEDATGKLQFEHVIEKTEKVAISNNPELDLVFDNLNDFYDAVYIGWEGMDNADAEIKSPEASKEQEVLTSATLIKKIKQDPTQSFWLKQALEVLAHRDLLDAYNDVKTLMAVFKLQMQEEGYGVE